MDTYTPFGHRYEIETDDDGRPSTVMGPQLLSNGKWTSDDLTAWDALDVTDEDTITDELYAWVAAEIDERAGCPHSETRRLYEQRPPSEGRKLTAAGRKCESCGALLSLAG